LLHGHLGQVDSLVPIEAHGELLAFESPAGELCKCVRLTLFGGRRLVRRLRKIQEVELFRKVQGERLQATDAAELDPTGHPASEPEDFLLPGIAPFVARERLEPPRQRHRRERPKFLSLDIGTLERECAVYRVPFRGHAIQIDEHFSSPLAGGIIARRLTPQGARQF